MTTELGPSAVRTLDNGVVELTLPAEPMAVRLARGYLQSAHGGLAADVLDDVSLIVTELVANAVEHGAPEICLRLRTEPFAIDVAVLDHGPGTPRLKSAAEVEDQGSGRGLAIVDRLAAAWGVTRLDEGDGKLVWASVDRC